MMQPNGSPTASIESSSAPLPQPMPSGPGGTGSVIDLRSYWEILLRRRSILLSFFAATVLLVALYTFLANPVYRATALVLIEPQIADDVSEQFPSRLSAREYDDYYRTQHELIVSNAVLGRVVEREKLADDPELAGIQDLAAFLRSRIAVVPVRGSHLVRIAVDSSSATKAADWANAVARQFIQHNLEDRREATRSSFDWLTEQIGILKLQVEKSERALLEFKGKEDIVDLERRQVLLEEQLSGQNTLYNQATSKTLELQTILQEVGRLRESAESADSLPRVLQTPLVSKLRSELSDLQSGLARLSQRYRPKHPEIVSLESQIDDLRARLQAEVDKIIQSLEIEHKIAEANQESIRQSLDQVKRQSMELSQQAITYGVLKREAESNRQMYDVLLQRLKQTDVSGNFSGNNIRLIDEATPPNRPARPRKAVNLLLAMIAGALGGLALTVVVEQLDNTLKNEDQVAFYLHEDALGVIPRSRKSSDSDPSEAFLRAYDRLRAAISLYKRDHVLRTLLVTSSTRAEGKTTTVHRLGLSFARFGFRVLILDADMFQARICKLLGMPQAPGLSEFFTPGTDLEDIVRRTDHERLHVIPGGLIPPDPAAPLGTKRFREMLGVLKTHYDLVLIDSPPVGAVPEVAFLADSVDGVVVVVQAHSTPRAHVGKVLRRLRAARANILGVVLAQVEGGALKSSSEDSYYSYYSPRRTAAADASSGEPPEPELELTARS